VAHFIEKGQKFVGEFADLNVSMVLLCTETTQVVQAKHVPLDLLVHEGFESQSEFIQFMMATYEGFQEYSPVGIIKFGFPLHSYLQEGESLKVDPNESAPK